MEASLGGVLSVSSVSESIGRSAVAAIWFVDVSDIAPASMSSCGVLMALTVLCWEAESLAARVPTETGWAVAPVRVAPPEDWPESRMWIFERSVARP